MTIFRRRSPSYPFPSPSEERRTTRGVTAGTPWIFLTCGVLLLGLTFTIGDGSVNGLSGPELNKRIMDMIPSDMNHNDMEDYFKCDEIFGNAAARPILSTSSWMTMRRTYNEMVGPEDKSTIEPPLSATAENGYQVPIEVKEAPGKGRGVFATTNIRKGTLIHKAERHTALFEDGISFRRYLAHLPNHLACEVLQFAFTWIESEEIGTPYIVVDLDESRLVNEPDYGPNYY
jgi:hypothetical protein